MLRNEKMDKPSLIAFAMIELIRFLRLFSTNISFLTELCCALITQQTGQTSSIDIYSPPLESIRKRGEKERKFGCSSAALGCI